MTQNPLDSLTPEKMQLFVAGLSGLAPEEVRKAKVLYIRNAIAELKSTRASFEGFGQAQGCMSIIPIFWPVIGGSEKDDGCAIAVGERPHPQCDRCVEG